MLAGLWLATQAWVASETRGAPIAWSNAVSVWCAWAAIWALLTPLALWIAQRFPLSRPGILRAIAVHIAAGVAFAASSLAVFAVFAPYVGAQSAGSNWYATYLRLMGTTFLFIVPVYWLIVGAAHMTRLGREARERENRALQLEAQLSDASLMALRAQLQPHFLFNALNTVSVLMHEDVNMADRTLVLLSSLLRRALDTSAAQEVLLREEIAFLDTYLAIEKTRFANRLSYSVDIGPRLLDVWVPSLILQPLVENAVRHGLADRTSPVQIDITATQSQDMLHLAVVDNGLGMNGDASDGIGLSNTRARLKLLYGNRHTFELSKAVNGGFGVILKIPLRLLETP